MNQLTHWNPFKSLAKAESALGIDELLRGLGMKPMLTQLEIPFIRLDVNENDKAYNIKADIPGVKKEDIDISVDGRQVTISARTARQSEQNGDTNLYTERSEGQVYRSFALPAEVDGKSAKARYEDGVLDLTLPKKTNGSDTRIKIK